MNYSDIVVIVVLALMVGFVVIKKLLDDKSKNELKQFLSYISDKFEKIILDYVKKVDFNNITSIAQVEQSIINDLMDTLWDITQSELASYTSNQLVKYIIEKSLTIDKVRGLAERIFTSSSQVQ
jgi:cephalosporin-C deacetylase-like acetyl esterase